MSENDPKLFVKSYFASSVEEAIERAHAELGPDALLLNSRQSPPEASQEGAYEVVFGCRPSAPALPAAGNDPVEDLRKRMDELREMVARIGPARRTLFAGSVADELIEAGVEPTLAVEIEVAVQKRLRNESVVEMGRLKSLVEFDSAVVRRETASEIDGRFEVAPQLGRVTALVGPPGSGKTTCLIKLAVTQGLAKRRPVRLISADTYRIAAAAQLQTYAEVLGTPFILAETATAVAQAIDSSPADALILIDTPGYSAAALEESGTALIQLFRTRQDIDTHIVLTASMRLADMRRVVDHFEMFRPAKLLFSHLDETDSGAALFSEAARTSKPLSFFSTGQLVPEDIESASKDRVIRLLVPELPQACEAVA